MAKDKGVRRSQRGACGRRLQASVCASLQSVSLKKTYQLLSEGRQYECEELLTFDCSCRYEAGPRKEREEMRMSKSGMEDVNEMKLY